ncbi:DNA-binding protein [Vibrio cholerae]
MNTMNVAIKLRSADEVELAVSASQKLSAVLQTNDEAQAFNVLDKSGKTHEIILPRSALVIMVEVLNQLGQGNYVSLKPIHAELTTQEGADLLNMSCSTFIKLLGAVDLSRLNFVRDRSTSIAAREVLLSHSKLTCLNKE